jgi:abhydrolase domain-containing protein 6
MPLFIDLVHRIVRTRYRQAGFESRVVEQGRFTLHYYEHTLSDSSPTLVLVHGLGTSSSTWAHVLPELGRLCNIIALDLPGFGLSRINHGPGFASLSELHGAFESFIREEVPQPIILLGHSLGGWIAAHYAAIHQANVRHLVLVNNAGVLCDDTAGQGKAFQVESIGDLQRLLNLIWFRYPWYFKPFYPAVLNDLRRRRIPEFVQSIHAEDFLNEELRNLSMDVSIIWGDQDRLISMSSVEVMKRSIPRTQMYPLKQCGHVPQLECPREFVSVVRNILKLHSLSAGVANPYSGKKSS